MKAPKLKWKINRLNLNTFYEFMYQRHLIWYKRFHLKQPPPWTDNKILRDYKFTNVYRELDMGTIYYVGSVYQEAFKDWRDKYDQAEKNLIWYTVMYRLLNRKETFQKVGFVPYWHWNTTTHDMINFHADKGIKTAGDRWFEQLKALMDKGESIFTSAHRTCPTHKPGQTRLQVYRESLEYTRKKIDTIWYHIKQANSLEQVFEIFLRIPNVGGFISYEICCDLILVNAIPFTENDWANTGPGARQGVNLIFPGLRGTENYLNAMRHLHHYQRYYFGQLKIKFPFYYVGVPLSLRSIEHSLCEFCKYHRCLKGGRTRVKYRPTPEQYGQSVIRFPRN